VEPLWVQTTVQRQNPFPTASIVDATLVSGEPPTLTLDATAPVLRLNQ
jgi:hypothetical protein